MSTKKLLKKSLKIGGKLLAFFGGAIALADHFIHRQEYARKARKRRILWTIFISILGAIVAILLFPYRLIVKRNGDFEIRTLLLRVYRRSEDYDIPEGGADSFEIEPVEEDVDAMEV